MHFVIRFGIFGFRFCFSFCSLNLCRQAADVYFCSASRSKTVQKIHEQWGELHESIVCMQPFRPLCFQFLYFLTKTHGCRAKKERTERVGKGTALQNKGWRKKRPRCWRDETPQAAPGPHLGFPTGRSARRFLTVVVQCHL